MAQFIGPAEVPFLPRPTRAAQATIVTAMPTTTDPTTAFPQVAVAPADVLRSSSTITDVAVKAKPAPARRLLTSCVAVARRTYALTLRYKVELAPAYTVSTLTALGWWQHLAGAGGWTVAAYTGLGLASAAVGGAGLHFKNMPLLGGGTAVALALADVATAVGAGPGGVSLTAAAVTAGAGYGAYVPWLIAHRKGNKPVDGAKTTEVNTVTADAITPAADVLVPGGPFHNESIPYADDNNDDPAAPIRIGWDEYGRPVYLTLLYRHTLIAGASDWGKSGLVNLVIKKLLKKKHVELYGIDMKPGAVELGPWEPLMKRLARGPEEARDLLQAVRAECDRRGALLEELSRRELAAGRKAVRKWVPGVHGTAWWIVTDELGELIRQDEELRKEEAAAAKGDPDAGPAERAAATTYQSLLAIARGFGIQFISATQQPSSKVFGGDTDARGNYTNRICTRVGEAGHTQFIFGTGWKAAGFTPHQLTRPGEFYLGAPEMPLTDPPKCRAEYVTDLDIAADVAHLHSAAPSRPVGRFAPQGQLHLVKEPTPKPAGPTYPDGTSVGRDEWPDLYRVLLELCAEHGSATKAELTEAGPFGSRDTVRRALDLWITRGVLVRKAGKAEQFYLPTDDTEI
ncbi:FtsK/SpoIIIE domain-containing protein [Kitasatospora sp. NBC_00240]|uniref:FtsK/SpoIIIE domain-containing protein n=1 Tax=Kitasatospora sp. NBC_00240 TaxID=2903567 RepID=UPI00224D1A03|nr:FtsK/SpoIIIE domain-containing protein [Kitasatospora sp. NBC_00240]MCX5209798.1 FtsK/SpoIIIE domain-containing protein [Kitasatospora sp. NBC_00240]